MMPIPKIDADLRNFDRPRLSMILMKPHLPFTFIKIAWELNCTQEKVAACSE